MKKIYSIVAVILSLAFFAATPVSSFAKTSEQLQKEQKKLEQEARDLEKKKNAAENEKAASQQGLSNANSQIEENTEALGETQEAIDTTSAEIVGLLTDIEMIKEDIAFKQEQIEKTNEEYEDAKNHEETLYGQMVQRVKFMYEKGNQSYVQILLTATSYSDALNKAQYVEELYDYGITSVFLPEFDVLMRTEQETPYHIYDVGHHTIEVMKNVSPRKHMRYAALLHDIGKPAAKTTEVLDREVHGKYYHNVDHFKGHNVIGADMVPDIMKRLRMDNDTMKAVSRLVYFHDVGINGFSKKGMRRLLSKLGTENFEDLYELRIADMKGQSDFKLEERKQLIREFREYYEEIVKDRDALSIKDLKIDGTGLMNMGVPKGPEVGKILNALLEKVLENPSLNEKEELERLALEMINSGKREVHDVTI